MRKKSLMGVVAGIALVFSLFVYLWSPASDAPELSIDGIYVDRSEYKDFPIKGKGQKVNENFTFKIDEGKTIVLTRNLGEEIDPVPGQQAKIFYKVGRVFQNRVYLGYEWSVMGRAL